MRVHVHPADKTGCGYYRLRWPAEVVAHAGMDVTVQEFLHVRRLDMGDGTHPIVDVLPIDADVVVLQRVLTAERLRIMRLVQEQGVAVVVDIDDDFLTVPRQHPLWSVVHPRTAAPQDREVLRVACAEADMVTTSTPALAQRYGGHGRVRVLHNRIPTFYLSAGRQVRLAPSPVIGWAGPPTMHVGDLEVTGTALALVLQNTNARFRTIGSALTLRRLRVEGDVVAWAKLDTGAYAREVARFDVGMVPLEMNAFNAAKSWLKGLEMAALGVPFVASPSPEYRALADLGAGLLAAKPKEWRVLLTALVRSPEMRAEVRHDGYEAARQLTYERAADEWAEAWTAARDLAPGRRHPRRAAV